MKVIVAILAILLAAALLFTLFLGKYVEYTDEGVRLRLPWGQEEPKEPEEPIHSDTLVVETPEPTAKPTAEPAPEAAKEEAPALKPTPKGPAPEAERIWQETVRKLKQKPQLYGMARFGRLATSDNGLFTVVYDKTSGGAYVKMLSMPDKNAEIAAALSAAAGYPCTFRAAIEGTVADSDKNVLAAQEAAKKQAENNLDKVFSAFGRENVRVLDE